jgi:hypothetical protein
MVFLYLCKEGMVILFQRGGRHLEIRMANENIKTEVEKYMMNLRILGISKAKKEA